MIAMTNEIAVKRGPGRPPKYPWAQWLDGRAKVLTRGKDFDATTTSMRQMVLQMARARGLLIRTEVGDSRYLRLLFPDAGVRGQHTWPVLSDEDLDALALGNAFSIPQEAKQNFGLSAWREYLEHELGQRGRALLDGEWIAETGEFRFTLVPQRPHLPEHLLDKAFESKQVSITPEKRRPFSDQQWIDYLTDAFGAFRPGNPTFEVDPDTGVMAIDINPEADDE